MKYTVGVITYNRPDCVDRVLASLRRQTSLPDEVVVVDDSDSDESERVVDRVREAEPPFDLEYVSGCASTAQPGARNRVLERATGDVVCFVDDDVYCEPMWLDRLDEAYRREDDVLGVGGPALLTDESLEPVYDWYIASADDQNRINEYAEDVEFGEFWIPPRPVETEFLLGANMSFRAEVLDAVGGFDTDFRWGPAYYEETDVMAACRELDGRLLYHPDAMVCHVQSESGGSRSGVDHGRSASGLWCAHNHIDPYWFAHNHVLFAAKHSESFARSLLRLLVGTEFRPPSVLTELRHALATRDTGELRALLAGYRDGLLRLRQ